MAQVLTTANYQENNNSQNARVNNDTRIAEQAIMGANDNDGI